MGWGLGQKRTESSPGGWGTRLEGPEGDEESRGGLEQELRGETLTSIVIHTVGLNQSYCDGPPQRVVILLRLRLPEDGIAILAEVLLGPVASRELPRAILLAEHCQSVQAIVADVVAGDVGQAGRHHPHATALIRWDRERSPSLTPRDG